MHKSVIASDDVRARYAHATRALGRYRVAREVGFSSNTLASLVAGFGVTPTVLAVAESRISEIERLACSRT